MSKTSRLETSYVRAACRRLGQHRGEAAVLATAPQLSKDAAVVLEVAVTVAVRLGTQAVGNCFPSGGFRTTAA
eukprot:904610-Amphidinium_carterae.1